MDYIKTRLNYNQIVGLRLHFIYDGIWKWYSRVFILCPTLFKPFYFNMIALFIYIFFTHFVDDDENELRVGWVFKLMYLNREFEGGWCKSTSFFLNFIFEPQITFPFLKWNKKIRNPNDIIYNKIVEFYHWLTWDCLY